jgi:DNA mismatch endonuclease (patch repair protein)
LTEKIGHELTIIEIGSYSTRRGFRPSALFVAQTHLVFFAVLAARNHYHLVGGIRMDVFSSQKRRKIMQAVRRTRTLPEEKLAKALDLAAVRYVRNAERLPGKPDFVLLKARIAIFVHGCFWHGHRRCRKGRTRVKSNGRYWKQKIERNQSRDRRAAQRLRRLGYSVLTIWECDLRGHHVPNRIRLLIELLSASNRTRKPICKDSQGQCDGKESTQADTDDV